MPTASEEPSQESGSAPVQPAEDATRLMSGLQLRAQSQQLDHAPVPGGYKHWGDLSYSRRFQTL